MDFYASDLDEGFIAGFSLRINGTRVLLRTEENFEPQRENGDAPHYPWGIWNQDRIF